MSAINIQLEGSNEQVLTIRVPFAGNLDIGSPGWRKQVVRLVEGALKAPSRPQRES